jgi:hypothetical protein
VSHQFKIERQIKKWPAFLDMTIPPRLRGGTGAGCLIMLAVAPAGAGRADITVAMTSTGAGWAERVIRRGAMGLAPRGPVPDRSRRGSRHHGRPPRVTARRGFGAGRQQRQSALPRGRQDTPDGNRPVDCRIRLSLVPAHSDEVPSGKWLEFGVARSPGSMKVSFQAARSIG